MLMFTIFVHVVMSRIFFANIPYTDEAERARCGLFTCGEVDFMTRAQYYSVHFYSVLSIVVFAYVLWQYTWGPTASFLASARKRFFVSGQGRAVDINYRDVRGIACYVPTCVVWCWLVACGCTRWLLAPAVSCHTPKLSQPQTSLQNRIDVKDTGNNAEKYLAADLAPGFPHALLPLPRGLDVQECVC